MLGKFYQCISINNLVKKTSKIEVFVRIIVRKTPSLPSSEKPSKYIKCLCIITILFISKSTHHPTNIKPHECGA